MLNPQDNVQTKRLMLAVAFSLVILFGFEFLTAGMRPTPPVQQLEQAVAPDVVDKAPVAAGIPAAPSPTLVTLANPRMEAGFSTVGGRMESMVLKQFTVTHGDALGYAQLHTGGTHAEYAEFGWLGSGIEAPGGFAAWQVVEQGADRAVLAWRNGSGQEFRREVALAPDSYEVVVTDTVANNASLPVTVVPYAQVHRAEGELPGERGSFVNHLGPMGVIREGDETLLKEMNFSDLADGKALEVSGKGGWWGITSQYFVSALLPAVDGESQRSFRAGKVDGTEVFSAGVKGGQMVVAPGQNASHTMRLYVGPKQEDALLAAGQNLERAIDWGWFRALARPFYRVLLWIHGWVGSWAIALFGLTLLLKIATFPLANKSYHAMAKMKKLQPQMEAMKEKYKDDQQGMALEMMKLYQREKVNPLSGCWPMLIQIPVFFAMYKVVLLAFEFRHAVPGLWPLDMWIHDMSVGDPLYILPVLMGISMWAQMRLNPPPADPAQAAVFKWMPIMFTFMFLWFPAALVWYWLVNNVLSIAQQAYIMRKDHAI